MEYVLRHLNFITLQHIFLYQLNSFMYSTLQLNFLEVDQVFVKLITLFDLCIYSFTSDLCIRDYFRNIRYYRKCRVMCPYFKYSVFHQLDDSFVMWSLHIYIYSCNIQTDRQTLDFLSIPLKFFLEKICKYNPFVNEYKRRKLINFT